MRAFPLPAAGDGERYNFRNGQGMGFEARAVQAAILAGKLECEECPWAETLAVLKTMDEARRALHRRARPGHHRINGAAGALTRQVPVPLPQIRASTGVVY